jgi:hypothetical protein
MALTLDKMVDEVREALRVQLRVRGRTLAAQLRKAGRRLPRGVRRDGAVLVEALALAASPKLARQVDMRRAQAAHRHILQYLDTVDIGAKRRDMALQIVASIALALLVTGCLVIAVLALRGFV